MHANALPGSTGCVMYTFDNDKSNVMPNVAKTLYNIGGKVWLNLTNGLEAAKQLDDRMIPYDFCRFRSCSFEQKNWGDAIDSMPDDMLMRLALGQNQVIIDYGANRACSRAMRQGIPIAIRMLSLVWGFTVDKYMWIFSRNGTPVRCDDSLACIAMRLNKKQKSRIKYFGKYVSDKTQGINIAMLCAPTTHDGDYDYHIKQAIDANVRL